MTTNEPFHNTSLSKLWPCCFCCFFSHLESKHKHPWYQQQQLSHCQFITMTARAQAQDAASWYFSHIDPFTPNHDNIRRHLRGPLLAVTINALHSMQLDTAGEGRRNLERLLVSHSFGWNLCLERKGTTCVWLSFEKNQSSYGSLFGRMYHCGSWKCTQHW